MEQRKYFKYRINELEEVYKSGNGDIAVLEELEEELHHRSTQRARKLLNTVQKSIGNSDISTAVHTTQVHPPSVSISSGANDGVPTAPIPDPATSKQSTLNVFPEEEETIDWGVVLPESDIVPPNFDDTQKQQPLLNKPADILDTWTVLEALSPQSYKKPNDLVIGQGSVAYLKQEQEPWRRGEKSRPQANLYYMVYLGAIDVEKATQKLLTLYQDKRIERPSVRGFAALGVILLDKRGIPIPDTGLALSSFGWSYARALQGKLQELKSWEHAENKLIEGLEKYIYRQDKDGELLPFSLNQAQLIYRWILRNCEIPVEDVVEPSFAIRLYQPFNKGEPETPLLNSFYLDDLQQAKMLFKPKQAEMLSRSILEYPNLNNVLIS